MHLVGCNYKIILTRHGNTNMKVTVISDCTKIVNKNSYYSRIVRHWHFDLYVR